MSPTYELASNTRDQQNRLVRELHATHESVYEYDGESRRVRIKELENSVETKNETFVWCGSRICQKRSGSTVTRNYFEQGFEEGTSDYFYAKDHLGSVREVVGSNGTTVASRVAYDPWGKVSETGSVLADFGFTGHYFDRPTGLALTWWRGYDPLVGRWLSKDPIGLDGGENLYGYVENDPANNVDPDGLQVCPPNPPKDYKKRKKECQKKLNTCMNDHPMCHRPGDEGSSLCAVCFASCVGGWTGEGCSACGY